MNNIYFVSDNNGIENAIMDYNNKQYRVRSEVLILDNRNKVYIVNTNKLNQYNRMYKIPGGSLSSNKGIIDTAISEAKEECRFNIINVKYSNYKVISNYKFIPEWHKRILWPLGVKYYGVITFICVGIFKDYYNGFIKEQDMELEMLNGRFEDIDKLDKIHKLAVENYISTAIKRY